MMLEHRMMKKYYKHKVLNIAFILKGGGFLLNKRQCFCCLLRQNRPLLSTLLQCVLIFLER